MSNNLKIWKAPHKDNTIKIQIIITQMLTVSNPTKVLTLISKTRKTSKKLNKNSWHFIIKTLNSE
jgi:hypothetical protein